MSDLQKLVNLLKNIRYELMTNDITIISTEDESLIRKGIQFDNGNTCYYGYNNIDEMISSVLISSNAYAIYYKEEFIGIVSVFFHSVKDLNKLEISITLNEKYRGKGIGSYLLTQVISAYFDNTEIKSFHLSIREDNTESIKLAEKLGFIKYPGSRKKDFFTDLNGNKIPQVQYLLTRKKYETNKK